MTLTFERLWVLLLLPVALLIVAALAWPTRRQRGTWLAALLRVLMLTLLLAALAGPVAMRAGSATTRQVVLVDRSASVGDAGLEALTPALGRLNPPHSLVVQFAERPSLVVEPDEAWPALDAPDRGTDLEAALRFAGELLGARPEGGRPSGEAGSVLLISDGLATRGEALAAAAHLAQSGVRVDVAPLAPTGALDAGVEAVAVPLAVWAGDPFSVTVSVYATGPTPATLEIERDGLPFTELSLDLTPGENHIAFSLAAEAPGLSAIDARLTIPGDARPENDALGTIVLVQRAPHALIVAHRPDAGQRLHAALNRHAITANLTDAPGLPADMDALLAYQLIILEDIAADQLSVEQLAALKAYVQAQGRGLIVFGGPSAYTLGGYAGTALEDLLPVKLEPPERVERPPASLLLILDHSESMAGIKIQLVKEAAMRAVEILRLGDQVGVLAFNHTHEWAVPLSVIGASVTVRQALDGIHGIQPTGGTNLLDPLRVGVAALLERPLGQRHIVLLTDGISAVGERPEFREVVEIALEHDITVSSIAVGDDADVELLALIAEWGQGRFRLAQRPQDIPRMMVAETQYAASEMVQRGVIQPQIEMPHPLVSGFTAADFPPLEGHVALLPRPVFEADTVLTTPLDDPLLAAWQYGLGRVAAWTGDAAREWSPDWSVWPRLSEFWIQMVRYVLPDPSLGPLLVQARTEGSRVTVTVNATGADSRGINLAEARLLLAAPDDATNEVALPQTAPGEYAVTFDAPLAGAYRGYVTLDKDGQRWETPVGFAVGYSPEYSPRTAGGETTLRQIAALTGGVVLAAPAEAAFAPSPADGAGAVSYAPWLLLAAVLCWPIEIAARRRWRPWR